MPRPGGRTPAPTSAGLALASGAAAPPAETAAAEVEGDSAAAAAAAAADSGGVGGAGHDADGHLLGRLRLVRWAWAAPSPVSSR